MEVTYLGRYLGSPFSVTSNIIIFTTTSLFHNKLVECPNKPRVLLSGLTVRLLSLRFPLRPRLPLAEGAFRFSTFIHPLRLSLSLSISLLSKAVSIFSACVKRKLSYTVRGNYIRYTYCVSFYLLYAVGRSANGLRLTWSNQMVLAITPQKIKRPRESLNQILLLKLLSDLL